MPIFLQEPLNFGWLDSALNSIVNIQENNLKKSIVKNVAKEIRLICQDKRERVKKVEVMLDNYSQYIHREKKQELFKLVAETLLYIQYKGVSIKITTDPIKFLEKSNF